jgi:hypothetical protein
MSPATVAALNPARLAAGGPLVSSVALNPGETRDYRPPWQGGHGPRHYPNIQVK